MDYFCRNPTNLDNERYLKALVASSLCLQILLYFVAPWRKRSTSKYTKGLISIVFSLSNWVPALTLVLITSCIVSGYGLSTAGSEPPLLTWAALMLLHLAGHGQEREFPLSLQLEEIGNESFRVILEFLFYSMIFSIAFLFNFESWEDDSLPETLGFALLACFKTFGKLKNLRDRCKEIKHESSRSSFQSYPSETARLDASFFFERSWELILGHSTKNDNLDKPSYRELDPKEASETVEAEQKLIYYKFYRGVVPSKFELLIVTVLLSVELSSSPLFIATIFINSYVILYAILFIMSKFYVPLLKVIKETEIPLLSTALLVLPLLSKTLYTSSLESSNMLVYILLITHHLVAYPIMLKTHYFHRVYRNDPHQWPKWSRIIPKFNVITYGLRKGYKMSTSVHHMLNTWPLTGEEQYKDIVGEFIFSELKDIKLLTGEEQYKDIKENVTRKVPADLLEENVTKKAYNQDSEDCEHPFGERVLLWQVTTKIMYHTSSTNTPTFHSNMSILLSDYMGYLLIVQPWIMTKQRGAVLQKCLDMWGEIEELTKDVDIQDDERVCKEILKQQSSGEEKAKTLVQGANDLAKKLKSTFPDEDQRWSFVVKVWVEKLAYASTHCDTIDHIQGLSQGGELASIVWLWMLHFKSMPDSPIIKNSKPDPSIKGTHAMKKSRPRRKKNSKTPKALRKQQFHHNYPSDLFFECISFLKRQFSLGNITFIFGLLLIYFIIHVTLHSPTSTFLIFIFSCTPIVLISVEQTDALKNIVNKVLYFYVRRHPQRKHLHRGKG